MKKSIEREDRQVSSFQSHTHPYAEHTPLTRNGRYERMSQKEEGEKKTSEKKKVLPYREKKSPNKTHETPRG